MVRGDPVVYFAVGAALSLAGLAIAGSLAWASAVGCPADAASLVGSRCSGPAWRCAGGCRSNAFAWGVLGVCALSAVLLLVRSRTELGQ